MKAYVNIGSNLGDRRAALARAVAMIAERLGCHPAVSDVVESEAWGYDSANRFLNVGLMADTELAPYPLLSLLREIEREIDPSPHRDAAGNYADRRIDIDLIFLGNLVVSAPELTLPHPRMARRPFVLEPLQQLDPVWRHPLTGLTAGEMLSMLTEKP